MKRVSFILMMLGLLVPCQVIKGQGIGSLLTSNFDGLTGILLNPASGIDTRIYMDINVFSGSGLMENNFFYIPKQDFRAGDFLFNTSAIPLYGKYPLFDKGLPFKQYPGVTNAELRLEGGITGPSILISTKKESIGFYTRLRVGAQSNLPETFMIFMLYGTEYKDLYTDRSRLPAFTAGYMLWGETGFHYARLLNPGYNDNWYLGANLKLLTGYQAAHIRSDAITYSRDNKSGMTINSINMEYSYTAGVNFLHPSGYGASMDIGLMYVKRGKSRTTETYLKLKDQSTGDYRYKAGISLTDLGAIRYFRNITGMHIESNHEFYIEDWSKKEFTSLDSVTLMLAKVIYGNAIPELVSKGHFSVPLAPVVSAQFDYHLQKQVYINVSLDMPIIFSGQFMKPPVRVLVCPRYESHKIGVWFPVSYNSITGFQTGLAIRLGWFTIGTERLEHLLVSHDFTGMDGYLSFHIPLVKNR